VKRTIVGNGPVCDGQTLCIDPGSLLIENGRIAAVGTVAEVRDIARKQPGPPPDFLDAGGRLILPGFLNPHHHLYSTLAVGLTPRGGSADFSEILSNLWWPLDAALGKESVYLSALLGLIDSVRHGVTAVFDHHASMSWVRGSLDTIAGAFELAGIKGLLCFECSDRMGEAGLEAQIEENLDFVSRHHAHDLLSGCFGLHANLTLGEGSLAKIAARKPADLPIHVHCGEDRSDLEFCRRLGYSGPLERLSAFGLLNPRSILAHAVHLSDADYRLLEKLRPLVVANPESNANNRVGRMPRDRISRFLLGTDGMSGDLVATLRSDYLLGGAEAGSLSALGTSFFATRTEALRSFFADSGSFRTGMRADIAVLDYIPLTPLSPENLMGHLVFGARDGRAFATVSEGRLIYHAGRILFCDEEQAIREAKRAARELHGRYYG
jgi:cytosine/adenosine deaminase-related metal-dependent hydrolase